MQDNTAKKRLDTRAILIAATFLVLASLFFAWLSPKVFSSGDKISPGLSHTIELRENGFYPKEITIEKGSMVTFTTTLARPFWPASAYHPRHSIYSEFDSRESISQNNSWDFTFSKIGMWGFHDHLTPGFNGIITVLDSSHGLSNKNDLIEFCSKDVKNFKEKSGCLRAEIVAAVSSKGLEGGGEIVEQILGAGSRDFYEQCHGGMHILGEIAYEKYKSKKMIADPNFKFDYCGYGFFHGFIESALAQTGNFSFASDFCDDFRKRSQAARLRILLCFHGIGHGAADTIAPYIEENFETMFGAVVPEAIDICKKIVHSQQELEYCAGGIFHSIQQRYISSPDNASNHMGMCRALQSGGDYFTRACYEYFFGTYLTSEKDFGKAAQLLKDLPLSSAFLIMNTLAARASNFIAPTPEDAPQIIAYCRSTGNLTKSCIGGIAVGYYWPAHDYERARLFCQNMVLQEIERAACFEELLRTVKEIVSPGELKGYCNTTPEKYSYYCSL